jgi:ATP-dependent Clp protease adaptor protein ClpS
MPSRNPQDERELTTLEKVKVEQPRLYEVVLHNDDYTTQVFVVYVLMRFFQHDAATANEIMLHVHTKGVGVAGVYPRDIAETKASQVVGFSRKHEMPLECSVRRQSC